jgi:quinolinate synthase
MAQTPQVLCSRSASNMTADFDSMHASLAALTTRASRAVPVDHVYVENTTATIAQAIDAIITSQQALKWMRSAASREVISHSDPAAFLSCLDETQQLIAQADEQVLQSRAWIAWFEAALDEAEALPR